MFYVLAGYTSKIDSVTGFVNMLPVASLTNMEKKRAFFCNFDSISYDDKTSSFAFAFDYNNFEGKANAEFLITKWTLYSREKRILTTKVVKSSNGSFSPVTQFLFDHLENMDVNYTKNIATGDIDLTKALQDLFDKFKIDWRGGRNFKE